MENQLMGGCVIVVCLAGYLLAFREKRKGNYRIALWLLVLTGLALRLYSSADLYLHEWDERYHALVAKHLMQHWLKPTLYEHAILARGYTQWTLSNIWLHKQPLPLWLMAASLKMFGLKVWTVRMPSVLLSTAGIALLYDIAQRLYDKSIGFIAAFLFSINGAIIELAAGRHATDHVDVAFMTFILLGIWCAARQATTGKWVYALAAGASMGAAILCKWLPALIIVPTWAMLLYRRETTKNMLLQGLGLMTVACSICLPWQLYILHHYRGEALFEYAYNSMHLYESLSCQRENIFFHFTQMRIMYGELVYLPVIWYTCPSIHKPGNRRKAILLWLWLPYLFFSLCATKMSAYTLFAAPALFIITANAYYRFREQQYFMPKRVSMAVAYLLLLLPVRYCIERVKPFDRTNRDTQWNKAIVQFASTPYNNEGTVIFNCEHYTEMMFATKCTCYIDAASDTLTARLKNEGYTIFEQEGVVFKRL